MNIKIKLNIAGQDLEITMEEALELKAALDKLLPAPRQWDPRLLRPALREPPSPFPTLHQPSPLPTVTCAYPPPNIRPSDFPFRQYHAP